LVEGQWFAEFDSAPVILRRWLLQLLGFGVVLGLGVPLQLQQLKRCWRLRQEAARKSLPAAPLVALGPRWLVLVLGVLLLLLAGGFTYLMVQARDLIAAPFSGKVIMGIPVLADLPPFVFIGLAAALLPLLLLWPFTTLRITLAAALAGSATAVARGWSLWLPALLAVPFNEAQERRLGASPAHRKRSSPGARGPRRTREQRP
jgi:hypothetical protein